ncbi:MAG: hypothetical protein H7641_00070 [Candidatus Heimdallarchaeota archaeon]|nr:hypothetical protein [Candidatus Heimdallarchaeota archaeon]MCK4875958.1 hypothetical protein [Candidatus Heimdallarchaeota archaeon]
MEETPEIADIPQIEKTSEVAGKDETSTAQKIEQQISDSFQTVSRKLKETVNIELFLPDIQDWIFERIKTGTTLIIGDKIGAFAEKIAKVTPEVVARESSSSYVSPKTEVKDAEILRKLDMKPFKIDKFESLDGVFYNIIVIFTLRRLSQEQTNVFLNKCKRLLAKDGQLIVVGEFYPKSVLLYPITAFKEGVKTINSKILKRRVVRPLVNFDKTVKQLELKFYDVKYDAGGRIRTYVLTKRWGALLS